MLTDIHNSPDMPILRMRGINKTYPGETPLHVLKGVDLDIHQGELVSIMEASGSGKSTLLNVIGILDTYDEGTTIAKVADLSDRQASAYALAIVSTHPFSLSVPLEPCR